MCCNPVPVAKQRHPLLPHDASMAPGSLLDDAPAAAALPWLPPLLPLLLPPVPPPPLHVPPSLQPLLLLPVPHAVPALWPGGPASLPQSGPAAGVVVPRVSQPAWLSRVNMIRHMTAITVLTPA